MVNTLKPDDISVLIAGVFALVMGVVQVVGYNSWTFDYRGLITLLGWVALLKGIAILFVPGYMERFARAIAWGNGIWLRWVCFWSSAGICCTWRYWLRAVRDRDHCHRLEVTPDRSMMTARDTERGAAREE